MWMFVIFLMDCWMRTCTWMWVSRDFIWPLINVSWLWKVNPLSSAHHYVLVSVMWTHCCRLTIMYLFLWCEPIVVGSPLCACFCDVNPLSSAHHYVLVSVMWTHCRRLTIMCLFLWCEPIVVGSPLRACFCDVHRDWFYLTYMFSSADPKVSSAELMVLLIGPSSVVVRPSTFTLNRYSSYSSYSIILIFLLEKLGI